MARKRRRKPSVPKASAQPRPRPRPVGVPAEVRQAAVDSNADLSAVYSHVSRDLKRIAIIAVVLFALIAASPFVL